MLKMEVMNLLKEIRGRLDYAERNINTHMLEETGVSGKMPVDGIVISILRNSKDSMITAYNVLGLDTAEVVAAYDRAILNSDNRNLSYTERKELISGLKKYTYVEAEA